jgi:glycosyltransferase involved in cell wall biosynthesis
MSSKTVAIVQRVLPHYRVEFFRKLERRLAESGIGLRLVYGDEAPGTVPRTVPLEEPWAHRVANRYLQLAGTELVWQPCLGDVAGTDLVIVEHAGRLVVNYVLLAARAARRVRRLAFWGHGRNFQAGQPAAGERLKRLTSTQVDWWFAYTEASAEVVHANGVARDIITVVDNSIDTAPLARARAAVTSDDLARLREQHRIAAGAPVALFCGGLHPGKQIGFLLDAAERIRTLVPGFELVIIGDGPEQPLVDAAAARHAWIHPVGPIFGPERAAFFALASAVLMPAHVGLVIVDSFVTGTPMFATSIANHSPEIAYLESGTNGVMTAFDVEGYARAVADHLADPARQRRLQEGCAASARRYTLDNMVENFATGVRACVTS